MARKPRQKKKKNPNLIDYDTFDLLRNAVDFNDSKIFIENYDLLCLDSLERTSLNCYLDLIFNQLIENEDYEWCQTVVDIKKYINSFE